MPVRHIEVTEASDTVDKWDSTDYIVAGFALIVPIIAAILIVLSR